MGCWAIFMICCNALDRKIHLVGDLLGRGFVAVFLQQLLLHLHHLVQRLDHVHRDADRARLVGDRAVMAWRIHQVA